jgi:hypothetical protein
MDKSRGDSALDVSAWIIAIVKATWMSDGSHWPGTWLAAAPDHSCGDHAGMIQVTNCLLA